MKAESRKRLEDARRRGALAPANVPSPVTVGEPSSYSTAIPEEEYAYNETLELVAVDIRLGGVVNVDDIAPLDPPGDSILDLKAVTTRMGREWDNAVGADDED